jgi:sulfonate transport system permease protein
MTDLKPDVAIGEPAVISPVPAGAPTEGRGLRWVSSPPRWVGGVLGVALVLAVWEVLAIFFLQGEHVMPSPVTVLRGFWDYRTLLRENTGTTLWEAAQGWMWGNGLAIALAFLFVLVPTIEAALLRLAIASYCLPIIAIAPILNIIFKGDQPKVVLAALSVFFTTLIGTVSGLRSVDPANVDLIRANGGGAWLVLVKVRIRSALPSLFAALKIAAPAALLGAVIGEYLGGERGLGVAMINSELALDVVTTWTLALWTAILAGAAYALTSLVARLVTPWAKNLRRGSVRAEGASSSNRSRAYRFVRPLGFLVLSVAVPLVLWEAFIKGFHLNPYFAKSPLAVWHYVITDAGAASHRSQLLSALVVTLHDAVFGYVAGTVAAVMLAISCMIVPMVEAMFMPIAIALRSVPLVAMTPLIALAFGRGVLTVTVIAGIVTFFPTFVNVGLGLRSAPDDSILLMRAFDGSQMATMIKVRMPSALPALFASARIAAPGALTGAVLAEWLATGRGLGFLMLESGVQAEYAMMWAGVVAVTLVSVIVYSLVSVVEGPVIRRFGS